MEGMCWFAMKRWGGNPLDTGNRKHLLSVVSPSSPHMPVIKEEELPFDGNESIALGGCGRLLYIIGRSDKIVVWDSATTTITKVFPPPPFHLPKREAHRGWVVRVIFTGLGYDATSRDYKLVRYYQQQLQVSDTEDWDTDDSDTEYDESDIPEYKESDIPAYDESDVPEYDEADIPTEFYADVYSFKCGNWKMLKKPIAHIFPQQDVGLYLVPTGRCYWVAYVPDNKLPRVVKYSVLSYDFASQNFEHFPVPDWVGLSKLVEFKGGLGLINFSLPTAISCMALVIYARKENAWSKYYDVSLDSSVYRPLLLRDDSFLLLVKMLSQDNFGLEVYDLVAQTSRKLNLYSSTAFLEGFIIFDKTTAISDAETTDPDSIPVATTSPTPSEDKEKEKEKQKQRGRKR